MFEHFMKDTEQLIVLVHFSFKTQENKIIFIIRIITVYDYQSRKFTIVKKNLKLNIFLKLEKFEEKHKTSAYNYVPRSPKFACKTKAREK